MIFLEASRRHLGHVYGYNNRRLVESIIYGVSAGSSIPLPAAVTFAYDAAGNRTSMTDGSGSLAYSYDQLSRMTSETRTFTGLPGSSYTLSYGYNLAGQLTSLSEPSQFGSSVSYAYDQAGRLTNVTGAGFAGGVSQFASNMKYRATNAVKEMDYGNGFRLNNSFNSRLQITNYQVKVPNTPVGQGERARSDYEYHADGQIKAGYDRTDQQFNREYAYDHVSRLINATTASAAYYQSFMYDAFDNLTQRGNGSWRYYDTTVSQYQNSRNVYTLTSPISYPSCCPPQPSYWTYDADGNVTHDQNKEYTFDAAGNNTRVFETSNVGISLTKKLWIYQDYDADGQRVKRVEQTQYNTGPYSFVTSYYLRSSVLDDSVITELTESGQKRQTFVYADGAILAKQRDNQVTWMHIDPLTNSARETNSAANLAARVEFDPLGNDAPLTDPQPPEMTPDYEYLGNYGNNGNPYDGASGCTIDGQPVSCSFAAGFINIGAAAACPNNDCGPRFNGSEWEFLNFTAEGMGYGGRNQFANAQRSARPKLKPAKNRTPKQREKAKREAQKRRSRDAGKGNSEGEPRRNIHVVDFMTLINEHLTIEHFTSQQESWIRYELEPMLTYRCSQAFPAGVKSPARTILQLGLTIRPAQDLYNRTAKDLNLSERSRTDAIKQVFGTTRIVQGGTTFGLDGGAQIYLHDRAFQGETWWPGYHTLGDVLRHESIHGGGQPPIPHPIFHDLWRWKYYNQVMKACSR